MKWDDLVALYTFRISMGILSRWDLYRGMGYRTGISIAGFTIALAIHLFDPIWLLDGLDLAIQTEQAGVGFR